MTGREGPRATDDAERVAALMQGYGPAIRSFFARRMSGHEEVDDLTQEVFAHLLKRARIDSIANIEGYLFQIAANLLRERGRRRAFRQQDQQRPLDAADYDRLEDFSPERILLGREAYALMLRALQELPERTRTVFILSRYEDMTGAEIARKLGVSESAVEKHMAKALAHLRARTR